MDVKALPPRMKILRAPFTVVGFTPRIFAASPMVAFDSLSDIPTDM